MLLLGGSNLRNVPQSFILVVLSFNLIHNSKFRKFLVTIQKGDQLVLRTMFVFQSIGGRNAGYWGQRSPGNLLNEVGTRYSGRNRQSLWNKNTTVPYLYYSYREYSLHSMHQQTKAINKR